MPSNVDIVSFLRFDGKPREQKSTIAAPDILTLGLLRDKYLAVPDGSLEETTLDGIRPHFKHLVATLGERFPIADLSLSSLQDHADRRKDMPGQNGTISSATIKKELLSLRTAWNWAAGNGWVQGRFPSLRKVRLAKPQEKPHFQTREEIERQIQRFCSKPADKKRWKKQIDELWGALYLTLPEITELLDYVHDHALHPWIYPLFRFAAHTGARRSEMLRTQIFDLDFVGMTVVIHEKKRAHDKRTPRRVPLRRLEALIFPSPPTPRPGTPGRGVGGLQG